MISFPHSNSGGCLIKSMTQQGLDAHCWEKFLGSQPFLKRHDEECAAHQAEKILERLRNHGNLPSQLDYGL